MLLAGYPPAIATHAALGTPVADAQLAPSGGDARVAVLGRDEATVIVFFRPDQGRSRAALKELAQCRRGLAGERARWVALVPEGAPAQAVAAMVRDSGFDAPVLVDAGDAFYGALGLSLHPVVVIVDRDRRLAAFEPFRTVNFCAVTSAHLRHALKEISDEELRAALDPPAATSPGASFNGKRYRSLAERLLRDGNADKALEMARKGLEGDEGAGAADGHALIGRILAAKGDCAAAKAEFEKAISLDKSHAAAREGLARCPPAR